MDAQSPTVTENQDALSGLAELTLPQKKSYILSMFALACADGELTEEELGLLAVVASRMQLSEREFEAIMPTDDFSLMDIRIDAPEKPEARTGWLKSMIMMVAADGVLTQDEYDVCLYFCAQLGFSDELLDAMIAHIAQNPS